MALGGKAATACLTPNIHCLLVLCFLQNNVYLITAKQTYVGTPHRVPAAEVAASCHAGLPQRHCIQHQANEFALPGVV